MRDFFLPSAMSTPMPPTHGPHHRRALFFGHENPEHGASEEVVKDEALGWRGTCHPSAL
jgi:hypothetical protein